MKISYNQWKASSVYLRDSPIKTTMEEAMLDFFYNGIAPWIQHVGYAWVSDVDQIARKFVHFCYILNTTVKANHSSMIQAPEPSHRNLPEDRDTFDMFADCIDFSDILEDWSFRSEIVGTRLDYMIREFCYVWVDVEKGSPSKWTEKTFEMNEDQQSDEEKGTMFPDGNWSRRKYDLY